ncbi:E3 ubiquitin-protein ligase NEURL3 [Polymixia lowei]
MLQDNRNFGPEGSHRCGFCCLGPLTFHNQAVGDQVTLSQGGRRAERSEGTFKNGLVFSSRPVRVRERVCLRVRRHIKGWHGALRLGFTTVPPTARTVPLPRMAIPDLTHTPGHWAGAIPDHFCYAGAELEFWVSRGGTIYYRTMNSPTKFSLVKGVDLSQPLWAMIDIYGQTCSVFLLGSEKKETLRRRKSCPAPEHHRHDSFNNDTFDHCHSESFCTNDDNRPSDWRPRKRSPDSETVKECVVCMAEEAVITLVCGHQCLCLQCTSRIFQEFGTCPLCRKKL